ncbi:hypothetical protein [Streptomyces sp. NPDC017991]|uniref:hypothetical protein n=1 Tax=Streptomyces sp. NPDC017991 TaxID=3365026 RepID=UPI0037A7A56E
MHSFDAFPVPLDAAGQAATALDSLRPAIDAVNHVLAGNAATINAALALGADRIRDQVLDTAERMSQVLAAADRSWRDQLTDAFLALGGIAVEQIRALDSINLTFDTAELNRLLNDLDTWRDLTHEQRDRALDAAQSAYATTAAEPAGALPDDLAATVRDIADADIYLPITVSRQTFALFIGAVVLMSAMTLSFSSETADGVVSKGIELSALATLAMYAAGALWDRRNGEQENDQSASRDD